MHRRARPKRQQAVVPPFPAALAPALPAPRRVAAPAVHLRAPAVAFDGGSAGGTPAAAASDEEGGQFRARRRRSGVERRRRLETWRTAFTARTRSRGDRRKVNAPDEARRRARLARGALATRAVDARAEDGRQREEVVRRELARASRRGSVGLFHDGAGAETGSGGRGRDERGTAEAAPRGSPALHVRLRAADLAPIAQAVPARERVRGDVARGVAHDAR
eukprot:31059-Pelagococcus_subviridis.AAC.5